MSVYDGRDRIGGLIERGGGVDAFDMDGVYIGSFSSLKAASAAIDATFRGGSTK